ncbi:hypothetical protein [Oceanibaculum nanhaiense]|uniref:hypothetical protein n=1 Tax=Oceanibaculum nanhaiense TaxID=1909734 RepID=UPI00396D7CC6
MKRGLADIVWMAALCCLLLVFVPHAFAADRGFEADVQQAPHSYVYVAEDAVSAMNLAHPCDRAATSDLLDCGCAQLCLVFGVLPAAMGIDDAGKAGTISARPYRIARAGLSPAKHPPRSLALV